MAEEIRRSLENLDAIIQQHDDGGLTEEEMLNLPAPAPELLDLGDPYPPPPFCPERRAPPPAPARKSSIKPASEDRRENNGHAMSEEDVGIDQSSRSVADILQKFSRASTPPKMPTVPPALRPKGPGPAAAAPPPPPPPPPPMADPMEVPPPAAFRTPEPEPPAPPAAEQFSAEKKESPEREDFGFARLKKLAELSSTTGEDVHKQMSQKGVLRRAVTIDVAGREEPSATSPVLPPPQIPAPNAYPDRRASSSAVPEEDDEREAFAFSRLKALAEQSSGPTQSSAVDDDSYAGDSGDNELDIDYSQVPGYIRIDSRLPNWKRTMVEKKNKEAIEAYLKAKEEEEKERRKWANVPAWKRNLVQKKAAVKKDNVVSVAPAAPPEPEPDDPKVPTWKRGLQKRK